MVADPRLALAPTPSRRQPRPVHDACLRDSLLPCHTIVSSHVFARHPAIGGDRATLSPPQPLLACAMRCDPRRPAPDSVEPATLCAALRLYASAPTPSHSAPQKTRAACRAISTLPPSPSHEPDAHGQCTHHVVARRARTAYIAAPSARASDSATRTAAAPRSSTHTPARKAWCHAPFKAGFTGIGSESGREPHA